MTLPSRLAGILAGLWIAGCTESNPFYVPPDAGDAPSDGIGDVPVEEVGDADAPLPDDAGEADVSPPPDDAGEADVSPPPDDAGEVDVPVDVPGDTPADLPPDVPPCGNGTVDPGEECDDDSDFCVACALEPPAGWVECADAAGNPTFFLVDGWPGNHSADDWRDRCQTTIDALGPVGHELSGLALFYDQELWDCISGTLDTGTAYWVGARQDHDAGDYAEPGGGWYWNAWDGAAWTNEAPIDAGAAWLGASYDNAGGTGAVDCARLTRSGGNWVVTDYSCTANARIDGICMVRY